jgi:hypothetical protein
VKLNASVSTELSREVRRPSETQAENKNLPLFDPRLKRPRQIELFSRLDLRQLQPLGRMEKPGTFKPITSNGILVGPEVRQGSEQNLPALHERRDVLTRKILVQASRWRRRFQQCVPAYGSTRRVA